MKYIRLVSTISGSDGQHCNYLFNSYYTNPHMLETILPHMYEMVSSSE